MLGAKVGIFKDNVGETGIPLFCDQRHTGFTFLSKNSISKGIAE
jgi:hypothetical protein